MRLLYELAMEEGNRLGRLGTASRSGAVVVYFLDLAIATVRAVISCSLSYCRD